jgi:hypothetical protein
MTANATRSLSDPLAAFMAGAFAADSKRPVPLVATNFTVTIEAGLAVVETTRRFHNAEDRSIEATITFPVPVHAVLFSLKARIGERLLTAHAESRAGARRTYETAVERGRSAVLHEEVLRGVHMLSVAHVPPGADIEVVAQWAITVSFVGEGATLRIPLTVGDIYGRSPLPDSDALAHGGPMQGANLAVRCADGDVELIGGRLEKGRAFVPLNAPIDLRIAAWPPRVLTGRAADGREVTLKVERPPALDRAIGVAILVDHSYSMDDPYSAASGSGTKHHAVIAGFAALAGHLGKHDAVDLWEFDDTLSPVGSTRDIPRGFRAYEAIHWTTRARLCALVDRLTVPSGGTEIGDALAGVMGESAMPDILLVTDGKSHALQVQRLAAAGRRITVVLMGEDSLEANVGHLAALTGGDIFVAAGAGLGDAMVAALATLRRPHEAPAAVEGELRQVRTSRGGAVLVAEWRPSVASVPTAPVDDTVAGFAVGGRAVAAFAASLALPCLELWAATELAVAEGLVTHLTSLVLVDEEGTVQDEIPAVRKVSLPTPSTWSFPVAAVATASAPVQRAAPFRRDNKYDSGRAIDGDGQPPRNRSMAQERRARDRAEAEARKGSQESRVRAAVDPGPRSDLAALGATIDWDLAPNDLLVGDLSRLDRKTARLIENAAALAELVSYAASLGISPVVLVVALLAHAAKGSSRSALRIANALLGAANPAKVERVKEMLCLS